MFEGSKSPFPFLKEEKDEIIKEVHRIICNLVSHPEKVDQAMNVFLSEENKKKYEIFKEELKRETPMELAVLPTEWRQRIYAWIDRKFYPKPEQVKDNSLEDILKIAKEMLEHFEKCKKTSPAIDYPEENEIEEGFVKENQRSVSTVNSESYEKVEDNECGGEDEKQAAPPPSPPESDEPAVTGDNVDECPDDELEAEQPNGTNGTPPALQPRENSGTVTIPIPYGTALSSSTTQGKVDQDKEKPPQRSDPIYWKGVNDQAQAARLEELKEHNAQRVTSMMGEGYNPTSASNSLVPTEQSPDYSAYENSLNVMLIGETGVGKTTFINGFQNYLNYASLDEALAGEPIVPVRTSFDMVVEKDSKPIDIRIEPPYNAAEWTNEHLFTENGQSRTQNAMIHNFSYTFNGDERIIRLVDTPGVMDTRGDKKDKENYYNTVEVIKQLKQIHAICVLLKPNEARFTQEFSHALDFLLLYLPQTAVQNLVFCFTSTEPFNFVPSQTLLVLEDYLKALEAFANISVSATKENIFCFDNNCFRFQCTVKQRPEHISKKHDYETSWNNNTKQLTRMLGYIQTLTPYSTADSVNIARVEKRLRNLVDTFVDITKEHAKKLINLKARNSYWTKDGEIADRDKSFKYILKCCCYFTDYLRRTSIGIEDVFGIKLQKLIMDEEKNYKLVKSAESYELILKLQKIATDYKTKINTLRHEKRGKATTEEIEQILHVAGQVNYYGGRIAAIDGQYQKKESFREKSVKC